MIHGHETMVYKLDNILYGLKQALNQWHEKHDNLMTLNEFKLNEEINVFIINPILKLVQSYVDYLHIFGSNNHVVNIVKSLMSNNFDIKGLREANVIFGIKLLGQKRGFSWINLTILKKS